MSRVLRLLLVAAVALGAVFLAAAPAGAHATLDSTEPVGGSALDQAPGRIVLRFSEAVQIPLGSVRVYASPSGRQIETGSAGHEEGGRAVVVKLPALDDGNYIVTWRVTSADSHPIHGAFTFSVGPVTGGTEDAALIERLLESGGGSTTVGAVYAVVRFAAYSALILLVGGLAFVALVWPAGAALARIRRMLWAAWGLAAVSTAVGIPVQGVYSAALPLSKVVSSTVWSGVLDERFGRVWTARLGVLAVTAARPEFRTRVRPRSPGRSSSPVRSPAPRSC
jgi:copper transport protein